MIESYFYPFIYFWIALAIIIFFINLKVKAPYGRHTSNKWGATIDNKIGWILMELPALITCPLFFIFGSGEKNIVVYLFIFFWIIHYFNRTFIFPFRIKTTGKKIPLSIVLSGQFFNVINGFICGYYLGNLAQYEINWFYSLPFIMGSILFITGFFINQKSDHILIQLRKPGETHYKIPNGFLFNRISCPNHFGEIIEWLGFGIMTGSIACFSFFFWTFCNLVPRALAHHKWYKNHFEFYPKERKAVFPYIF